MLDTLIREVGARLGLGDQARPLIQMLVAYIANPSTGGLPGFLDKFRSAGGSGMVQSWLGSASSPEVPTTSQLESALGSSDGLLSKLTTRLGLPYEKVTTAVAALLPMLSSRMTPGGTVPTVLPAEFSAIARDGASLLGLGGAAAATTAATAARTTSTITPTPVPPASGGMGKWLPWLIAALVVIFGVSYCAKNKTPADAPAPAAVPAPVEPAPAPAPAPEPAPVPATPAADTFTAPEGAGILDGMQQDVPLLRVFFDTGKTDVAPEFADKAKALVDYLQANSDVKAIVSGFNDPTGDPAKNAELSKSRAEAVKAALVAAGVAEDRVVLEKPAETTDTGATNAASRRVDVMLRK